MTEIIYDELLNERMLIGKLSNGLNCYIIPKEGFSEKFAILSVNYGSVDNRFAVDGRGYEMPEGIAHFLEHKMFESTGVGVFEEFNRLGANVNAFTNFSNTAYHFSCTDNFEKSLRILLDFVQKPHFTNENVDKEKEIIAREINMYLDDPGWAVYLNMLDSMFFKYPVKHSIAGTVASVNEINKEMLYKCHEVFYRPDNMSLVCIGDFDCDKVFELAESCVPCAKHIDVKRLYGSEPMGVVKEYVTQGMPIARKMFNLGFKDIDFSEGSAKVNKIITTKIVLDYALGESTEFFRELYGKAMIDCPFSLEYICGNFFGFAIISASGDNPDKLKEMIFSELERIKSGNFETERLERIIKKSIGRFIKGFNNLSNVATAQIDMCAKGINIFDVSSGFKSLTPEVFPDRLGWVLKPNNNVLSVAEPQF